MLKTVTNAGMNANSDAESAVLGAMMNGKENVFCTPLTPVAVKMENKNEILVGHLDTFVPNVGPLHLELNALVL